MIFTSCFGSADSHVPDGERKPAVLTEAGVPPVNPEVANMGNIELNILLAQDYYREAPIVALIGEFSSVYPNIKVNLSGVVWEQMDASVKTAVYRGNPPDIAHFHAYIEASQGLAQPVDDLWEKWGREEDFLPAALKDVEYQGKKYGIPLDINCLMLYYNKDIFRQAGLSYPDDDYTLEKLKDDAIAIVKSKSAPYGLAISASGWTTYGLVKANGASFTREGKASYVFDCGPVREVFQFLHDVTYKYECASMPPLTVRQSDTPVALFRNGEAAMFFSGPWELPKLKDGSEKIDESSVGVALLPSGSHNTSGANYSVQGGGSLFIPTGAKNTEAAFELMKWFICDKYAMRMAKEMGRHPVVKRLYDDAFYDTEIMKTFVRQLENVEPMFPVYNRRIDTAWKDAIVAIYRGEDINRILKDLQRDTDEIVRLEGIE